MMKKKKEKENKKIRKKDKCLKQLINFRINKKRRKEKECNQEQRNK